MADYMSAPINTMSSLYGPGSPLARGGEPQPANVASGGLPIIGSSAAGFWVGLVLLLIAFRIAWEMSPLSK
jgi:hypothetical protein